VSWWSRIGRFSKTTVLARSSASRIISRDLIGWRIEGEVDLGRAVGDAKSGRLGAKKLKEGLGEDMLGGMLLGHLTARGTSRSPRRAARPELASSRPAIQ
jgi:hypothetical protein